MQASTYIGLPRVQVLEFVSSPPPKVFAHCTIDDFRREEKARTIDALNRIKHKQEEIAEASDGTYDPRTSVFRAREEDVKNELQIIERRLQEYAIPIQLKISSLTDALRKRYTPH